MTDIEIETLEKLEQERKVVSEAILLLEQYGWHQGMYYPDEYEGKVGKRPCCIAGALMDAAMLLSLNWGQASFRIENRLKTTLSKADQAKLQGMNSNRDITSWNDYIAKDKTQVINKLKKVRKQIIKELEQANG